MTGSSKIKKISSRKVASSSSRKFVRFVPPQNNDYAGCASAILSVLWTSSVDERRSMNLQQQRWKARQAGRKAGGCGWPRGGRGAADAAGGREGERAEDRGPRTDDRRPTTDRWRGEREGGRARVGAEAEREKENIGNAVIRSGGSGAENAMRCARTTASASGVADN
ncbi:hypothetical protein KM043_003043 [Ampulex compressa]|nr:hypothetical protein KM043_003043 [Ampulex compressa]